MQTTTELAAACRAEIERRLAVCEAAAAGPWRWDGNCWVEVVAEPHLRVALTETDDRSVGELRQQTDWHEVQANAVFIADSRNQRPGELRVLLAVLKRCETEIAKHKPTPEYRDSWQATRSDFAEIILRAFATALELEGK